jgi:dipeptidyl aminopeptidase/acylaminoacyl peptidase
LQIRLIVTSMLVGLAFCPYALAKGAKGLTVDQLLSIKSVRGAVISGDGQHLAFTVSSERGDDEKPGGSHNALWVLRDGAVQAQRYTPLKGKIGHVNFTPDSKRLAFLRKRGKDAKQQLWWMPLDGGEAEALTDALDGVMSYAFSPNGSMVAYVTPAPVDKEREKAVKKGFDEVVVHSNPRHHLLHVHNVHSKQDWLISPTDKTVYEYAWSPDGKEMLVMWADSPRSDDNYMFRSLWRVPVDNKPKTMGVQLAANMGKMVQPSWSPDGTQVAWRGASVKNDATNGTIWLLNADGGTPRAVNAHAKESVYDIKWLASDELLVSAVKGTQSELSRRKLNGESTIIDTGTAIFLSVSIDKAGKKVAFVGSTPTHPLDLYTGSLSGKIRRVLNHNPWLLDVKLAKQESVSWSARDGKQIQGVMIYPLNYKKNKRYPLVMMVHGGPEWQALNGWISRYLWPGQALAAKGYAVLAPNYRGSAGRGATFAMADHRDLGGKELLDNVDAIAHFANTGLVDPARVGMMGGSYGGYMSALAATKASEHFAATINFAGIANWMSFTGTSDIPYENSLVHWDLWCYDEVEKCWQGSPMAFINKAKTPLLLLHGKEDKRVPISQAWELYTAFRVKGIPTEFVIYPREGHGLREKAHKRDAVLRSIQWFAKYLKGK